VKECVGAGLANPWSPRTRITKHALPGPSRLASSVMVECRVRQPPSAQHVDLPRYLRTGNVGRLGTPDKHPSQRASRPGSRRALFPTM
jgi:hypothetical protein